MTFRDRLLATLRALQRILDTPGVLVVGSEVPNLLEPGAASTLVVSQDVDLALPLDRLSAIKQILRHVEGLAPSPEEPSVYVPTSPGLIEANFLGLDRRLCDASDTYVFDDPELPLMVFGPLGLLRPGPVVEADGLRIPLPRTGDLMLEKLLTDRTGEKGARDLLVVAGLFEGATPADLGDLLTAARGLSSESRYAVRSAFTVLSLMAAHPGMPDPARVRGQIVEVLRRLEALDD